MPYGRRKYGATSGQLRPVRVLVDMDGVVADFDGHLTKVYRQKYPDLPYVKLEDRDGLYATDQYAAFGDDIRVGNISMTSHTDVEGGLHNGKQLLVPGTSMVLRLCIGPCLVLLLLLGHKGLS